MRTGHRPRSPIPRTSRGLRAAAALVLACVCACDPAARTRLEVIPRPADASGRVTSALHVADAAADAVVAIVARVAERHELLPDASDEPGVIASHARRWDANADGHARAIRVSVSRAPDDPVRIEVTVFEWLAFGHSALGERVLAELEADLREAFGADAVRRE